MKPTEQVILQFKEYKITNVALNIVSEEENGYNDLVVELDTKPNFGFEKSFSITFALKVFNKDKTVNVEIVAIAVFETNEVITEEFKKSSFVNVNAPAIVFPYLRAFISTITLNCGYDPIVLPTFNFLAIKKSA